MINKKRIYGLLVLALFVVSGCSGTSKADYSKVVDTAVKANKELVAENAGDKENIFDRKKSNIMIWEDENNYFVYLRKNRESFLGDDEKVVYGDGYKLGKSNNKWDSSPATRTKIKEFLNNNEEPVYKENNVTLVSDDLDMR
ncbi:hypothetical protein [Enterococcus sp. DIV1758]|uniref:hypothetical protein n=1 Tax=Enterococcus sp. DIV1758 TaxID=2774744 RepID=UPI003F26CF49